MKLVTNKSKNKTFYYAIESFRDENGKSTSRIVEKIGEHSELLKKYDDPLAYAKNRVFEMNQAIKNERLVFNQEIDFSEKLEESNERSSASTTKNIGCLYITELLKKLKIDEFMNERKGKEKYNNFDVLNTLIIDRFVNQSSKLGAVKKQEQYINNKSIKLENAYRFLTTLYKNSEDLQAFLYEKSKDIIERDQSVLFYDCSNFYFEIENDDLDMTTEDGILQYGFRKYFASKEHRPNPVVQMGLFADKNGIPVSYRMDRGNFGEQKTVVPMEVNLINKSKVKSFIYCSDGGLGSYENRFFNAIGNRHYVVTHSLKKTQQKELDLIFSDQNWKFVYDDKKIKLSKFKEICDKYISMKELTEEEAGILEKDMIYKAYPITQKVDVTQLFGLKGVSKIDLEETLFITFSAKYYFYEKKIFTKQMTRAENWLEKGAKKAKNPNDPARFIKKTHLTEEGEVAENELSSIDNEQVEKESNFHGFYAVATDLDYDIKRILKINSDRWQIEYCFRLLKSDFEARPIHVSTEDHIQGHFAICYLALTLYKIIEKKVKEYDAGLTSSDILTTIKNMCVDENSNKYYKALYTNSKALQALESFFNLHLDKKNYKINFFKNI